MRHVPALTLFYQIEWATQAALVVKNPPVNVGDIRDSMFDPLGQEDSPGGGHGNPLQYPCLENSMGWLARIHRVPKSQT